MEDPQPKQHATMATPTVSETERVLSKLGHGYKKAKAQQILRLLKDQDALNQRFKDCALAEDDDDDAVGTTDPAGETVTLTTTPNGGHETPRQDADPHHPHNPHLSAITAKKKLSGIVDPSRCRTSMGFYNQAECSDRGDGGNKGDNEDFEAETDAALMEEREALLGPLVTNYRQQTHGGRRLFRLQQDENEDFLAEESLVHQPTRSSRPKTGIAATSAKGKQYRRPAHTDARHRAHAKPTTTVSTSVSKLDAPLTTPRGSVRAFCDNPSMPRDDYGSLVSTPRASSFQPLTPRHNDLAGGASFTPRGVGDGLGCTTPRQGEPPTTLYNRLQHDLVLCLSPRTADTSVPLTPRQHHDWNGLYSPRHNELAYNSPRPKHPPQRNAHGYYSGQLTPRDEGRHHVTSPRYEESNTPSMTPRTHARNTTSLNPVKGPRGMKTVTLVDKTKESSKASKRQTSETKLLTNANLSCSLADRGLAIGVRMPTTPRSMLTVDQLPVHAMHGGQEMGEVVTPRRQKSDSTKSKASLQRTAGIHQNLSKLSDRGVSHPISLMKLPPLEVTMNKPAVIS